MSLNTRFGNCFDFINNMKEVIKSDPDRWDNIYMEHSVVLAECDLMEMEIEAAHDAEMYDSLMNGNAFRSSKRTQRRKQNIRRHKADRRHGKSVPQSDKKYWDEQSGTFYRWDEKRKTFHSHKKPVVHRKRKTFRNRLNSAMDAREQEDARLFTGLGELLEDIAYLEDRIHIYEEDIKDLEYEKAFGYLTEKGEQFLEDYKKELEELKEHKQYKEVLLRTATH